MWKRSPSVAGSFYPSDPNQLSRDIEGYLEKADKTPLGEELLGLIVPHAGYVFSGPVAAYSYAQLVDKPFEVVVVLAPSHRARFNGASVIPSGIYETPLGETVIDGEIGRKLIEKEHISFLREVHQAEHSLEVQVPFLQTVVKNFTIVPIIVGTIDLEICRALAEEISSVLMDDGRSVMVVISTDLSHYYSYEDARSLDGVFVKHLKNYDIDSLYRAMSSDETQACGEGPVLTGLYMGKLMGANHVEILKYANSGDTAGGRDQVVGYLAAALTKSI